MPAASELMLPPAAPAHSRVAARRWLAIVAPALVWVTGVTLGFAVLGRHSTTPGEAAAGPSQWPSATRLSRAPAGRSTLLLFVHPKCPCTRATMGELEILMARSMERAEACVVFVRPPEVAAGWERTDLWQRATRIPGVVVRVDEGGVEAQRFGAVTSGEVLVYDPSGALRFAGGITAARGHSGDNAGRSAVEALLAGHDDALRSSPVFGCRLLAPSCGTKDRTCAR
jgi:hypothetical protein